VNWSAIVFDNLYNRLQDLFAWTKPSTSRGNIEFIVAQVVDILFQNWFMVDLKFIILKSNEELPKFNRKLKLEEPIEF
jgi:hypothetical protein